jgi:hypothetical protein
LVIIRQYFHVLGRCDEVFLKVMAQLKIPIPSYDRLVDPIFAHATPMHPTELRTTSRPLLLEPERLPLIKQEPVVNQCVPDVKVKQEPSVASVLSPYVANSMDLRPLPWTDFLLSKSNFVKEEHNYCAMQEAKVECQFCWLCLMAPGCLFYPSQVLTEKAILSDSSEEEEDNSDDGPSNPKKCQNPGWFGKGYRKTCKSKKKRLT